MLEHVPKGVDIWHGGKDAAWNTCTPYWSDSSHCSELDFSFYSSIPWESTGDDTCQESSAHCADTRSVCNPNLIGSLWLKTKETTWRREVLPTGSTKGAEPGGVAWQHPPSNSKLWSAPGPVSPPWTWPLAHNIRCCLPLPLLGRSHISHMGLLGAQAQTLEEVSGG